MASRARETDAASRPSSSRSSQAVDAWRDRSGGAFDPRVEAMTRLWSQAAARIGCPTADELAAARALMAQPAWRLDPARGTAERLTDCPLSLNGIAKGYIVERACDAAMGRAAGVTDCC